MSYTEIEYQVAGHVARLTLNRPEKRNPIGPTTVGELLHALDAAKSDAEVRVVVLTGAGKVFSAGGDLSSMGGGGVPLTAGQSANTIPGTFVDLNLALVHLGKPTVARVQGHALAGGLGLVVACDIAIAAEEAQFATPEVNVGLWPMMIMATIFRAVPRKRGLELIMTGERVSASDAERIGLITRSVPAARLDEEVDRVVAVLVGKSPAVMRLGRDAFYATADMDLEPALRHLEQQLMAVLGTDDAKEGLMAFLEKRAPVWQGK